MEPVDQVVGKKNQVKIGLIGGPVSGGNFAQGVGFEKFPYDKFSRGSFVVETPEIERFQRKIGKYNMVGVSGHFEKRKLPGRFFGYEAPHDDESLRSIPPPWFVFELGEPNPRGDFFVGKTSEVLLDRLGDPGDNSIESRDFLEVFGNRMIVEGRVGSYPNLSDAGRQHRDAFFQNLDCVRSRMDVSRQVDPFPDIARLPLETEKGLVGGTPSLFWIEANLGSLLLSIDCQNLCIEVEDDRGDGIGLHQKMPTEAVVEIPKGCEAFGAEAFQKPPQGSGIWICWKARQILEDSILLQEDVGFDPAQTKNNWIKDTEDGVADGVSIVELSKPNGMGKSRTKFDPLEKLLQKI